MNTPVPHSNLLPHMLESGVHFGHQTRYWNPKMKPFIYGKRSNIYLLDILQTVQSLNELQKTLRTRNPHASLLVVGTTKQARTVVELLQPKYPFAYVTSKWLGGLLTNWVTMQSCIQRLAQLEKMTQDSTISKKQLSKLKKNQDRLETFFGGVKHLKKCPDYMIILNQPNELIAVKESNTLKIPNITVLDTNCNPDLATFKIPGNDDSIRSLYFLLRTMLQAFFMPAP